MSEISDTADLLATAREALVSELLPVLSNNARYVALMIANVMAIAAREQRLGAAGAAAEAARWRGLLEDIDGSPAASPLDLATLRKSARAAIRAGRFDDAERAEALAALLLQTATERVAISNPKALREDSAAQSTSPTQPDARGGG